MKVERSSERGDECERERGSEKGVEQRVCERQVHALLDCRLRVAVARDGNYSLVLCSLR